MVTNQEIQRFKEKLHRRDDYSHNGSLPYDLNLSEEKAIEISLKSHELLEDYDNFMICIKKLLSYQTHMENYVFSFTQYK